MVKDYRRCLTAERRPAGQWGGPAGGRDAQADLLESPADALGRIAPHAPVHGTPFSLASDCAAGTP